MAYTSSLLNCRTGNGTGGSNPPPSARSFLMLKEENIDYTPRGVARPKADKLRPFIALGANILPNEAKIIIDYTPRGVA